ncbi:MAG: arginine--tRNA ligase, partial [Devosia sp.]
MDVFALFSARIANAMQVLYPEVGADLLARIVVEPPRDASHGDLSTNAAMIVAKPLGKNPRDVAAALVEHFRHDEDVQSVEVAGPGFINFRLEAPIWHEVLRSIAEQGEDYGRSALGQGERVNIEYVSANPTGPMHVGHTRGAVFGDTLAALMAYSGFEVTREYYINDTGGQTITLGRSAFLRYREALGETIEIPSGFYPGEYLIPVGQALAAEHGRSLLDKPEEEAVLIAREAALAAMMELIKQDLARLNIHHQVFFSERTLHGAGGDIETTLA